VKTVITTKSIPTGWWDARGRYAEAYVYYDNYACWNALEQQAYNKISEVYAEKEE